MDYNIAKGKCLIEIQEEDEINGILLPDTQKSAWGIVRNIGKPCYPIYSKWEMFWYDVLGLNPCIYSENDVVLVPRMTGVQFGEDGKQYVVVFQNEISLVQKQ